MSHQLNTVQQAYTANMRGFAGLPVAMSPDMNWHQAANTQQRPLAFDGGVYLGCQSQGQRLFVPATHLGMDATAMASHNYLGTQLHHKESAFGNDMTNTTTHRPRISPVFTSAVG
ncbi:hypothetical protein VOLCADRAFT_96934 [Volvox carteri f. nagariensis]|uniref:Uncharacterized protein n=1 Tax=Volvox carteri f. nagariensis TaxID=3068 RepID=D8UBD3_VOLCA|nr:uncharacterized protein VOLCADRAFT_96934 [Volvox carteri f. nagariensis]EFJ42928.1 hypothetical protein VOLCADRAFT_96934 [Volvox carteri f. nagariensis]|eukprot:XP_002955968.1 hypothetical protein VOLCADRAFT_96934 [Volvox carteri f. nagariensis]